MYIVYTNLYIRYYAHIIVLYTALISHSNSTSSSTSRGCGVYIAYFYPGLVYSLLPQCDLVIPCRHREDIACIYIYICIYVYVYI